MRALNLGLRALSFNRRHDVGVALFHRDNFAADADVDVLRPENLGNGARDILILAGDETRRGLDDRHSASETAIELRKFEADIAAAEDNQMRGQKIDVHHRAVGQVGNLVETRDRRNQGSSAYIDEDLISPEHLIGDLDLPRSNKSGVALIDGAAVERS